MTANDQRDLPDHIGPYRVLERLGEGGMAEVYLAEQSEPVRRHVAVKILKAGMDSKQVVARFDSERQALAVLDHPHIAKVFDGGVADHGRPYFVMEYVQGVPITRFCDEERLSTEARLRLFAGVCRAVQHAHLKGLIHRDLKPANILVGRVDGEPQPKVIDFGIAKATEMPLTDATLETRIGQVVGTPQYMSPEQVGARIDIDSRADVYSLGVVLYELLTGALPLDLSAVRDIALPAVIREKVPPTPSIRFGELGETRGDVARARTASVPDLTRALKGDLDWIVMKAIEKDRARRYETPNALAADCERYLAHQAVLARPPSSGYQVARFVRRNRGLVAAASIAVIALIAGSVAATVGFLRATAAEQAARQEAETARQVSEFMVGLFESSDPAEAQGRDISAREVLDRGVARINETLADSPAVQASLLHSMASVYQSLGLLEVAETLASRALALRHDLADDDRLLADSLDRLGSIRAHMGEVEAAIGLHERALQLRESLGPADDEGHIATLQYLAESYYLLSEIEAARDYMLGALAIAEAIPEPDLAIVAQITGDLGVVYDRLGDFQRAETFKRTAVETFDSVHGPVHPLTATARNNLAITLNRLGLPADAAAVYREALDAYRTLYDGDHPNTANALNNLAQVLLRMSDLEAAERTQRESYAMFQRIFGPNHSQVGVAALNVGRVLAAAGRLEEADDWMRLALETQIDVLPDNHQRIFAAREAYADVLNQQGRFEEALPLALVALQYFEERVGRDHWRTARAGSVYADSLIGMAEFEQAEPILVEALKTISASLGADHPATASVTRSLVSLYEKTGRPAIARRYEQE